MIVFSLSVLSSCGLPLPPTCLVLTVSEARSYFTSTVRTLYQEGALKKLTDDEKQVEQKHVGGRKLERMREC
jgi:hypothetical protein